METTLFYVAGGVLIALALLLTLIGLRSDRFPSDKLLIPGIVVAALVVAATAIGAVELAKHEQEHRIGEANAKADVEEASETQSGEQAGAGTEVTPAGNEQAGGQPAGGGGGTGIDGGQLFVSTGCGSCHTLDALGSDAQGTIGPDLDTALADRDAKFIETSIVDPSAYVAKGFPDGTMPANYKEQLSPEQIKALVDFLVQSTSGGSGSSSG
ncbi:MAG: c-type cytochrome [Solirubrobacterales bacterium]